MTPRHSASRQPRRPAGIPVIAAAVTLTLAGCAVPGLPGATGAPGAPEMQRVVAAGVHTTDPVPAATPAPTPSPSPTAIVTPPAAPAWVPAKNDLGTGSVTHRVDAASHTLIIDYWTNEDPASWTPESSPLIRLNARIDGPDNGNAIKVTRFNVRADSLAAVLANDAGEFTVAPPFSYSSGVVVPSNPKAHSTQLLLTFDLLTETAPGSGIYARQTVLDTLNIGYAKPGSATVTPAP
ncbi:hypothetical protein ACSVHC_22870 [Arthrobacter sp. KNU-44]|uniref:hypothetical protein n=1 Tax=unclassified Arthrobacter TaxID=235627 RepID=UPI003F42D9E3